MNSPIIFRSSLVLLCLFFCLSGCNRSQETAAPAIPKALQDPSWSDISYEGRGYKDLVDELFEEMLESDASLKETVDSQKDLLRRLKIAHQSLYESDAKSNQYYQSARSHAQSMADSTAMLQSLARIDASEAQWHAQMSARDAVGTRLTLAISQLNDAMEALKIKLTLPQIEDYQRKMMPELKDAEGILAEAGGVKSEK